MNLQKRVGKSHPFDSLEQETLLNLWKLSELTLNRFGKLFREYGLTMSQYNVLRILRGHGKPLCVQEIAAQMIQTVPGMTGLIDRLEKGNYVQRTRSVEDRRVIMISITDSAMETLANIDQPLLDLHKAALKPLNHNDLQTLNQLVDQVIEAHE